jgi:long-chain acyl-CoA synthetase
MNLANLLLRAARGFGERPAVFDGERLVHDYRALALRVATLAGRLASECALRPGDRVALILRNRPAYVEVLFAIWHAGLVAVPINAKLHPRELAYILEHCGARLCFASDDLAQVIAGLKPELSALSRVIAVESAEYRGMSSGQVTAPVPRRSKDVAWLFYTSGTTGRPKGAMLTHGNLLAMTLSYFVDVDSVGYRDCILHAAPMSHGSGLYILPHVARAAAQVVPASGKFDPQEVFDLLAIHSGATIFAAPTMVKRLVEHPPNREVVLSHLKTVVYGGGPMYLEDIRRALAAFGQKFVQIYGQGESPMTITALSRAHHADVDHPRYLERLASVGMAQTVVEVRVGDEADQDSQVGETGEVLVRGDPVMLGYWNDPEATTAALRGGWLHTGDLGAFDEDGFLTLKDRSKDLIISGGSNIYPREVEEVLLRHSGVQEVSVIGRPHPEWGEEVVAFVVRAAPSTVNEAELDALCRDHIARFKRPKVYRFVQALPKNNYGKILKTELRRWLAAEKRDQE